MDMYILEWDKSWIWAEVVAELVSLPVPVPPGPALPRCSVVWSELSWLWQLARSRTSSLKLTQSGPALLYCPGGGQGQLSHVHALGWLTCTHTTRGGISYFARKSLLVLRVREGWSQLCSVLRPQYDFSRESRPQTSTWSLVAPRATDINIDPSCGKVVDTDRAFASSLGLGTTRASGGSIDHLDQYLPWWLHSPQIVTWIQVPVQASPI